jgi:hypothetical protein
MRLGLDCSGFTKKLVTFEQMNEYKTALLLWSTLSDAEICYGSSVKVPSSALDEEFPTINSIIIITQMF